MDVCWSPITIYVDRVTLFQHLIRSSMSWKKLVTSTNWRCEKHIWVDRILSNSWVILDQSVMIRLRLLLTCHLDECVLSRYPLVHSIRQGNLTCTCNALCDMSFCFDRLMELFNKSWARVTTVDVFSTVFFIRWTIGSCSNNHLSWSNRIASRWRSRLWIRTARCLTWGAALRALPTLRTHLWSPIWTYYHWHLV